MRLARGDIYLVSPPPGKDPKRARPFVIVSHQALCDSRAEQVICAPINSRFDGLPTEVAVGVAEGLKHLSAINCDQLALIRKSALTDFRGALGETKLAELHASLRIALAVE